MTTNEAPSMATFLDRTNDETMTLLRQSRDFLASGALATVSEEEPVVGLICQREMMRLVARLTQVMAWILAQKALAAGQITREQAVSEQFRLGGGEICDNEAEIDDIVLPDLLGDLMQRSRQLYQRVARLDEMQRRPAPPLNKGLTEDFVAALERATQPTRLH